MIVPSSHLLRWAAVVVTPFATLMALPEGPVVTGSVCIGVLTLLALGDAHWGKARLCVIGLELPNIVRTSKDRDTEVAIIVLNDAARARQLRVGIPWPREIESEQENCVTRLPDAAPRSSFTWHCTPRRRGRYFLKRAYLEVPSPLGLWQVRRTVPIQCEIRVYPNMRGERDSLAALFLNRSTFGLHVQRQVGKGREFEKLREYIPGDSFEDVHWKATAKRGHPVTKVFQIERTQEIYVVIDASRLAAKRVESALTHKKSARSASLATRENAAWAETRDRPAPSTETSVLERFVTAALTLGLAAEQQGDLFGLVAFSDKVHRFVRAGNGREHYGRCRDAIYSLEPRLVAPDFDELGTFLRMRLRRRALLVFLTDLDDPLLSESFIPMAESVGRQHLLLVNMLRPAGAQPLFADTDVDRLDQIYEKLGGHLLWHNLRQLSRTLRQRGAQFTLLENERLSAQLVSQYLSIKSRQLL